MTTINRHKDSNINLINLNREFLRLITPNRDPINQYSSLRGLIDLLISLNRDTLSSLSREIISKNHLKPLILKICLDSSRGVYFRTKPNSLKITILSISIFSQIIRDNKDPSSRDLNNKYPNNKELSNKDPNKDPKDLLSRDNKKSLE